MLWIAMGNDLYPDARKHNVFGDASSCFEAVAPYVQSQTLIFGGSSRVWQYNGVFAQEFDVSVRACLHAFRSEVACLNGVHGAFELAGIRIMDRIGHVDWRRQQDPTCRDIVHTRCGRRGLNRPVLGIWNPECGEGDGFEDSLLELESKNTHEASS